MKSILVPTDFSKLSKVAVSYALGLAKKIHAKVVLMSVLNASNSPESLRSWRKMEKSIIDAAKRDADKLISDFTAEKGSINLTYQHALGYPIVDRIEEFAVANKMDLIVMASKGATRLRKILLGSNAAAVIDNSSVPVIVVPVQARFKPIKKLVYATDGRHFQKEIKTVVTCARLVDASIEVLHVIPKGDLKKGKESEVVRVSKEKLTAAVKDVKIKVHVVTAETVVDGVNEFVHAHKVDLLAMFTHQLDFKEKVLGRSVTRSLALDTNFPLLSFNRTKR